jgi:hypothetical protein
MTALSITGALTTIQATGNVTIGAYTWVYKVQLSNPKGNTIAAFTIDSLIEPYALELGKNYVLQFTPITTKTGGVQCLTTDTNISSGAPDSNGPEPVGSATTYTYTLQVENTDGDPTPVFDIFTLTPETPLDFVAGQFYSVNFHLEIA